MARGPFLLDVDTKELQRFERQLHQTKAKAVPYAMRDYANTMAFEAQRTWKQELPGRMVLRNRYTEQSVRVEKTKELNPNRMQSEVGSIAEYMDEQELGGTKTKKGKHGIAIPGKPLGRKKIPKKMRPESISLLPRIKGHRSKQIAASLAMAQRKGGKHYAFLQMKKRRGIYLLDPGRKKSAVRKVWDLTKTSAPIHRNQTMEPAVAKVSKLRDGIWRESLILQLRRTKAFGF